MRQIFFVLALLTSLNIYSQTYFGVKGIGTASFKQGSSENPRIAPGGGIFLQEDFNEHFSLRQELLFTVNGYNTTYTFPPQLDMSGDTIRDLGKRTVQYQSNYLELPIIGIWKFGDKIKPYIHGGVSFKFNVLSKMRIKLENNNYEFWDIDNNGFDINLLGGLGIETKVKETPFHVELRYNHGLLDVFDNTKFSNVGIFVGFKL
jgi:hypothetical protein